jgi:ATP-dependent Clp protease protease subunit
MTNKRTMATKTNVGLEAPMARNLYFSTQVDQDTIGALTESVIEINDHDRKLEKMYPIYGIKYKPEPIKIYIDSYGGYVYQCFGLLSVMETSRTPIHTIVTGAAMSCGFMMLICGHKRFAYELSTPLYHQVGTGFSGKVKDMEEELKETKRVQAKIEEIVLRKTKITKEKLKEIYDSKRDWAMDASKALKLGVVDEIIK